MSTWKTFDSEFSAIYGSQRQKKSFMLAMIFRDEIQICDKLELLVTVFPVGSLESSIPEINGGYQHFIVNLSLTSSNFHQYHCS